MTYDLSKTQYFDFRISVYELRGSSTMVAFKSVEKYTKHILHYYNVGV